MKNVLACIIGVRNGSVKKQVDARLKEFKSAGRKDAEEIFKELVFCLMTANFTAEKSIKIQKEIGNGFLTLSEKELANKLKSLGHRFPNARAKYIVEARKHISDLPAVLKIKDKDKIREWFVKNVKGLGYKEASHFLRNIGFEDFAIIDFHIVDFLVKFGLVEEPKTITSKKYLEIERILLKVGKRSGLNMAELDLYMWYCETGKILK